MKNNHLNQFATKTFFLFVFLIASVSSVFGQTEPKDEDSFFVIVEEMPEFPGGEDSLMIYLSDNIKYPRAARELPSGMVVISFIVETDGSLTNFEIIRSLYKLLDEEALRVIKAMPKWNPGKQRGKAVRVKYNLPIRFAL